MIFIFRIQGFKNKQKPCSLHTLGVSSEWRDRKRVQLPHAALFRSESLVPYQQDGGKQATWTGWWRKNKVKRVIMWWGRSRHWAMDSPCTLCGWRDGQLRLWAAVSLWDLTAAALGTREPWNLRLQGGILGHSTCFSALSVFGGDECSYLWSLPASPPCENSQILGEFFHEVIDVRSTGLVLHLWLLITTNFNLIKWENTL